MKQVAIMAAALLAAGCGGGDEPAAAENGDNPLGETYLESLEKAQAVEDQVMESKDRIDAALEEADGGN